MAKPVAKTYQIDLIWKIQTDPKSFIKQGWKKLGATYFRKLTGKEFESFLSFFSDKLFGKDLPVKDVLAVCNTKLISSFNNQKQHMNERARHSPHIFCKEGSRELEGDIEKNKKVYTMEQFKKRVHDFPWNQDSNELPVIPVLHGTDKKVARAICDTGFSTLSTLDQGYFGQGMYFSTNSQYTVPYFGTKQDPTLILSFLIPGNPYPVTDMTHAGCSLKAGYQSHYILTNQQGKLSNVNVDFDEIVVNQEAQIVPAYLILFDQQDLLQFINTWQKQIAQNVLPPPKQFNHPTTIHDIEAVHTPFTRSKLHNSNTYSSLPIQLWNPIQVKEWLDMNGFGAFTEKFVKEGIDGNTLVDLTSDDLKQEFGMNLGDRKYLLRLLDYEKLKIDRR